jgi:glutathione S-transferase
MLAFGNQVGQPFDESLSNIKPWFDRMSARPSAAA